MCCEITSKYGCFNVIFVYASNAPEERTALWDTLFGEMASMQQSCLVAGDFNNILCSSEKLHGAVVRDRDIQDFRQFVSSNELTDLDQSSCFYTWNNNHEDPNSRIWCKLARAMGNSKWFEEFPDVSSIFLPPGISDHSPILISWGIKESFKKLFKYCRFWEALDNYSVLEDCWNSSRPCNNLFLLQAKLKRMKNTLKANFLRVTTGLDKRVDDSRLSLLNTQMNSHLRPWDASIIQQECDEAKNFRKLKKYQMIFYQQRTKLHWLKDGDMNTKYYHNIVRGRRSRNSIKMVQLADGSISSDKIVIQNEFVHHFKSLLCNAVDHIPISPLVVASGKVVEDPWCRELIKEASDVEIWNSLNNIGVDKSPGPDGFSAGFFKTNWHLIGAELCSSVRHCLKHNVLPRGINSAVLALIPKHALASLPEDYRPIFCCNLD
ncbi:hypothetical protein QQ045_030942 [Rhodiola kirilowii]